MSAGGADRAWLETLDRACELAIDRLRTGDEPADVTEFGALKRLRESVQVRIAATEPNGSDPRTDPEP